MLLIGYKLQIDPFPSFPRHINSKCARKAIATRAAGQGTPAAAQKESSAGRPGNAGLRHPWAAKARKRTMVVDINHAICVFQNGPFIWILNLNRLFKASGFLLALPDNWMSPCNFLWKTVFSYLWMASDSPTWFQPWRGTMLASINACVAMAKCSCGLIQFLCWLNSNLDAWRGRSGDNYLVHYLAHFDQHISSKNCQSFPQLWLLRRFWKTGQACSSHRDHGNDGQGFAMPLWPFVSYLTILITTRLEADTKCAQQAPAS